VSNVDVTLKAILELPGSAVVALVDYNSGMMLGAQGDEAVLNLDVAAAGNTEVIRAKMRTMDGLGINESIEDILITLGSQYHLIRLVKDKPGLFIYLVLFKDKANLAMARYKLAELEPKLEI
jgi:hypothetical protein